MKNKGRSRRRENKEERACFFFSRAGQDKANDEFPSLEGMKRFSNSCCRHGEGAEGEGTRVLSNNEQRKFGGKRTR